MILKVKRGSITAGSPQATLGPTDDGGYYVRVENVPEGVSLLQVIILFMHTVKPRTMQQGRYVFDFTELS